jgi:hypothetical protein
VRGSLSPTIDASRIWHHIGAMSHVGLSRSGAEPVTKAPASLRTLAKAAGVPHSTLSRILRGKRKATPHVAASVARALDDWGSRCTSAARVVRDSMHGLDARTSREQQ